MKLLFLCSLLCMSSYTMDSQLKEMAIIFEEESRFGLDPLKYQEFVKVHLKDIEKVDQEHTKEVTAPWYSCTKSKAVVLGSLITACSGVTIAIISGIITIIITIYK